MNTRRWLVVVLALAVVAAACTSTKRSSSPGGAKGSTPQIVSPADNALVTGPNLVVQVKTDGNQRHQVSIDGHAATAQFSPNDGGTRTATVSIRPDIGPGTHRLTVDSEGATAQSSFVVGKLDPGYLTVPMLPPGPTQAPVMVDVSTGSTPEGITARLNGRDISDGIGMVAGSVKSLRLGAHEGLKPGPNHLELTAYAGDGNYQTVSRDVEVSAERPLVGTGRDVTSEVGQQVNSMPRRRCLPPRGSRSPTHGAWPKRPSARRPSWLMPRRPPPSSNPT